MTEAPTDARGSAHVVRVEFTYEFQDFAEANAALRAAAAGGATAVRRRLFGWILFIILAVVLFILLRDRPGPVVGPGPRPVGVGSRLNLFVPLLPWVMVFGFVWLFVFRKASRHAPGAGRPESKLMKPGTPPPPPRRRTDGEARSPVVWLLVIVPLALIAYASVNYLRNRSDPNVEVFPVRIGSVIPLLLFVALLGSMLKRSTGAVKTTWDAQPSLHRPRVMEAGDDAFVLTDAVARHEHRWDSFTHVVETATQLLLFTGWYTFYFVPKRAFADAAELDAFRDLLRRHVAERPAPGFPVLPARPVL